MKCYIPSDSFYCHKHSHIRHIHNHLHSHITVIRLESVCEESTLLVWVCMPKNSIVVLVISSNSDVFRKALFPFWSYELIVNVIIPYFKDKTNHWINVELKGRTCVSNMKHRLPFRYKYPVSSFKRR